jgi:predicted DNA-binding protein with PD1-like motif
MDIQVEGDLIVAKFVEGDIIRNLEELVSTQAIRSAVLISGIGMLRDAIIGYFDGEQYQNHKIAGAAELVSVQGNIGHVEDTGAVVCHLHAALATADHGLMGGHLMAGAVTVVNEIALQRLRTTTISRQRNRQGLLEMHLE